MPTYQYACTECDHRFEAVQSFSEDSLSECPKCTGRLRKLFNAVGIVFKGSGFYRTDNRSSNSSSSTTSNGSSSSSSSSSSKSSESSSSSSSSSSSTTTAAAS
ncbi:MULTISPECIES: FmdB family zinc ribbon protein [Saccharopolyspora]|uniref:FmdB family transcriptional regulator n=1 Tax=Saccharopolyspora elongata TaxID=2530387 RepID=A0A4V2YK09_9PSEU|nr:FmdB family zinc ribbon protein [Saccharopolyspora elongata]TDD40767.1 FmdB family transcriptional regulator [Saccharopolyspora elongata]